MQKNKRIRSRISAFLLAAAVAFTGIPAGSMTAKAAGDVPEGTNLLARYPLLQDANDVSGNGKNGETHGSVTYNDGMVLPGGVQSDNASASYITLPGELFAGKENLTISVWIKSTTDKGNVAALFFGTKTQDNKLPLNYWLFNPTNPSGLFKSVFTDSNNSSAPYNTEKGVTAGATEQYKNKWVHYTTVLTENSVTGYINGRQVGTVPKSKKVTDFGSDLQAYIGRSNYVEDKAFGGSFQDLQVYEGAMSGEQVEELYFDNTHVSQSVKETRLPQVAEKLSLAEQAADGILMEAKKLELPSEFMGASVQWTSDKEQVITNDGQVIMPAQKETVTLTASLALGSASAQKTFILMVLPAAESLAWAKENLQIPYVLDQGVTLPNKVGNVAVSWSGSPSVKSDGTIQPDFSGKQQVNLEAILSYNGKTDKKSFSGWLLGADVKYVQSYTRTPSGDLVDKLARSMFLAYSENGKDGFTALHDDYGVLFMRAQSADDGVLTPKGMKDPYLFYTKDGDYGIAAVRTTVDGGKDPEKASSIMFYTTKDFVDYDEVGFVSLNTNLAVSEPICEYDPSIGAYRITWNDGAGNYYQNTLPDIAAGSQASQPANVSKMEIRRADLGLAGSVSGNLLPLENSAGVKLKNKLSKIVNTGMQVPEKVKAVRAADVQSIRATALYNDGSTAAKKVEWDLSKVDFTKPGTYTVTGAVTQPTFNNSKALFDARPDPEMAKYNGKFYFISTDEAGQGRIYIRQSDTLEGIKDSGQTLLMDGSTFPELFKACLWAPELHVIEGRLYIFFAGSLTDWSGVQSHVMRLKEGGDPMKIVDWETPIRVKDKDGNNLYDTGTQGITLDMTYFEVGDASYVAWAQRQRHPVDNGSWIYIATVDRNEPWKLTSDRTVICKPDYGWDNNNTFVVEGPFTLQRDGKIYMTFSGGATDHTYCVGLMTASQDSNLLDAASWRKRNSPILTSWSVPNQYGPGHNAYIQDDDGLIYNTYHAKWNRGTRSASIRRVHFDIDGDPVLDLVEERDLLDQYKSVSMQVEVKDASYDPKEDLKEINNTYSQLKEQAGQGVNSAADWKEFCDSLEAAEQLLKNPGASQSELLAAVNRLEAAAKKLSRITSLELVSKPAKTSYKQGEALELAGMKLEAADDKGGRHPVDAADCAVSGFNANKAGTQTITVTYAGCSVTFRVNVAANVTAPKASAITSKTAAYNSITIKWKKVDGASGYYIFRADSKKGTYKKVKTITKPGTVSYKDSKNVAFNKTYYYKIQAYKKAGNNTAVSKDSKVVSVKTALPAPSVAAKKKSKTAMTVKWKKVSGASGYMVKYSLKKKSGFKTQTIKKAKATSWKKSGLKKGKTYYVKMCAYRTVKGKKITGKWSGVKSVKLK